jgi:hypothetical protein
MTKNLFLPRKTKCDFPKIPAPNRSTRGTPEITAQIDALVQRARVSDVPEEDISDLVREIVVTALKTQHSQLPRGDAKILSRSLRELRLGFGCSAPIEIAGK